MNRTQRRQQQKSQKERVYTLTDSELTKMLMTELDKMKQDCLFSSIRDLMGVLAISLHDEFGFGKKRLHRLIDKINNNFECIDKGTVSLDEINTFVKGKGYIDGIYIK